MDDLVDKWVLQADQELRIRAAALTEAQAEIERLRRHLVATTDWMERTRASGDSGFWDWGADDVYTSARAALSTKGAADAQDGASSTPPEPPPGQ